MAVPVDVFSVLFNSVLNDLKGSPSAWDNVSSKAIKLSTQLNNVANSLSSFADAMQFISDNANNVKGASRDIGASLTRFCLRQKSMEKLIRNFATVLSDCFAPSIEKKVGDWRQRVNDIERRRIRNMKKWKQKSSSGSEQFSESRSSYLELLTEQRNQFIFFVNALLPIMDAEIDLLDEGAHVRQIRDSVASTANENDSHCIIKAIIEDAQANFGSSSNVSGSSSGGASKNDEDLWQRRMSTCGNNTLSKNSNQVLNVLKKSLHDTNNSNALPSSGFSQSLHDSFNSNVGSKNTSEKNIGSFCDLNGFSSQANTFTSVKSADNAKRLPVTPQNFVPLHSEFGNNSPLTASPILKPPLPVRQIQRPSDIPGGIINTVYSVPMRNALSISANDLTETTRCNSRPLSLSGCDIQNNTLYQHYEHTNNTLQKQNNNGENRSSTLLIAETLHQIDQLGVELDSYCRTLKPVTNNGVVDNPFSGVDNSNASLDNKTLLQQKQTINIDSSGAYMSFPQQSTMKVRYRPDNIKPPPPLPERRNSTITAATPTAPSIVDIRTHSGNGSSGIYQQPQLRPVSQASWPTPLANISQTTSNIVEQNEVGMNKNTPQYQRIHDRNHSSQENHVFFKYTGF